MTRRHRTVLILCSDEHDPRHAGFSGSPVARTPNIDRLAAAGAVFTRAYTPSPICVPARASLATGRWAHEHRCWDNAIAYDGRLPAWGHRLQRAGVGVESIGKLHYRRPEDDTGFDRQHEAVHIVGGAGQLWGCVRDPQPASGGGSALNRRIGVNLPPPTDEEKARWVLNYTRALQQETAELVDSVPWKWWAKYQKFDEQNARVEVVDLFHFLVSLAQTLGMSADDVYQAYLKKNQVNHARQETGYVRKDETDSKHI